METIEAANYSPSNNFSRENWPEGDLFKWHFMEICFMPIAMVVGIVGNLIVFYIYHFRWTSNTVTLYKRMLAALDLINLFLALPTLLYVTVDHDSDSFLPTCVFTSYIALGTALCSGGVLVIIASDRFMKLCLLRKNGMGHGLSKILFACCVLGTCIINIPCAWIFGRDIIYMEYYQVRVTYCFINDANTQQAVFLVHSFVLALVFLSIFVSLIFLYYKVVRKLIELSKKHDELKRRPSLAAGAESLKRQKQSQVMRKSAMVFIAITVVFFASYAPFFVTIVLSMVDPKIEGSMGPGMKALYDLSKLSPLVNNFANPFVYSFSSGGFRKEVKKLLTFKTCQAGGFFRRRALSMSNQSKELSERESS